MYGLSMQIRIKTTPCYATFLLRGQKASPEGDAGDPNIYFRHHIFVFFPYLLSIHTVIWSTSPFASSISVTKFTELAPSIFDGFNSGTVIGVTRDNRCTNLRFSCANLSFKFRHTWFDHIFLSLRSSEVENRRTWERVTALHILSSHIYLYILFS